MLYARLGDIYELLESETISYMKCRLTIIDTRHIESKKVKEKAVYTSNSNYFFLTEIIGQACQCLNH